MLLSASRCRTNIRSLLSSETLEDDLGLAVNAQVLDGLGIGRAGRAVATAGSVAQRRRARGGSGNGLHGCERGGKKKGKGVGRFPSLLGGKRSAANATLEGRKSELERF